MGENIEFQGDVGWRHERWLQIAYFPFINKIIGLMVNNRIGYTKNPEYYIWRKNKVERFISCMFVSYSTVSCTLTIVANANLLNLKISEFLFLRKLFVKISLLHLNNSSQLKLFSFKNKWIFKKMVCYNIFLWGISTFVTCLRSQWINHNRMIYLINKCIMVGASLFEYSYVRSNNI